jgi:hypothetical protein
MRFGAFADHRSAKAHVSDFFLTSHNVVAPAARLPPIISTD